MYITKKAFPVRYATKSCGGAWQQGYVRYPSAPQSVSENCIDKPISVHIA